MLIFSNIVCSHMYKKVFAALIHKDLPHQLIHRLMRIIWDYPPRIQKFLYRKPNPTLHFKKIGSSGPENQTWVYTIYVSRRGNPAIAP